MWPSFGDELIWEDMCTFLWMVCGFVCVLCGEYPKYLYTNLNREFRETATFDKTF